MSQTAKKVKRLITRCPTSLAMELAYSLSRRAHGKTLPLFIRPTVDMATVPILMVVQTLCFVVVWLVIDRYVSRHGLISGAQKLNKVHSCVYSAVSAILLFLTLSHRYNDTAHTLYHLSKFWEYIDVLTVRAGGGSIDLHFGFHHLTTPYLTFFRVLQNSEGWQTFAALNTAHHALMYAYFGGAGFVRPLLDFTGCIQLLIGIGVEIHTLWFSKTSEVQVWPHMFSAGLLGSYLILWAREMRMRRIIQRQAELKAKSA
ncbi:hypothetical protein GGR55DRAFT_634750 [Xylaria sp. FL0064]|nr:hypothetical protein GGR55DRAFT_634750 [Xylaria sp. FL0064]